MIADVVEALHLGAWDYLTKPIEDLSILTYAVLNALEKVQMRQEYIAYQKYLECMVEKQTEDLMQAKRELDVFAYAVSHDLRAPLRAVNGFGEILLEDYSDKLDEDGRKVLSRIHTGIQRMGLLIDGIQSLSLLNRAELVHQEIDISEIAHTLSETLHKSCPERQIEWVIPDHIPVVGDPKLITVLLDNLMGNAFKFTSKLPQARIEVGVRDEDGHAVFFVSDNGVGFDMAYAENLFGPFQRLHRSDEFEGVGMGLATVRRIVHRHGGIIWAESAVGKGATFSFTLSAVNEGMCHRKMAWKGV